jgi:hypothetical protein
MDPIKQAMSQLQIAFAQEAKAEPPAPEEPPPSKIWTPPGA